MLYHLLVLLHAAGRVARRRDGRARDAHRAIGARGKSLARRCRLMAQKLEPYHRFTKDAVGDLSRRRADDAHRRGHRAAAVAQRSDLVRGSRGDLPAADPPALASRGGGAGAPSRLDEVPRRHRREGALHHRRRRLGRGRQVDHRAHPRGAAPALAVVAQGRPRHHRRLPPSQPRARRARHHGPEGLSRELRPRPLRRLPLRHQVGQAARSQVPVYSHLVYDSSPASS